MQQEIKELLENKVVFSSNPTGSLKPKSGPHRPISSSTAYWLVAAGQLDWFVIIRLLVSTVLVLLIWDKHTLGGHGSRTYRAHLDGAVSENIYWASEILLGSYSEMAIPQHSSVAESTEDSRG